MLICFSVISWQRNTEKNIRNNKYVVFYYVFVSKRGVTDREEIKRIRKELIDALNPTISALYKQDEAWSLKKTIKESWLYKAFFGEKM